MRAWRVYLTDQTVRRLDILAGKPSVVAAWSAPGRVSFFDSVNGTPLGEKTLNIAAADDRSGAAWKAFQDDLTAPNGARLPLIRLANGNLHTSADGRMYLLQAQDGNLYLSVDDDESPLTRDEQTTFAAVAFDRSLGLTAALDSRARLHLYQPRAGARQVDVGLQAGDDWLPGIALAYGGAPVFCADGQTLVQVDASGKVQKRLPLHYRAGALVCSPDGQYVAVSDVETGVIRIYDGADLQPTHQRFATDLVTEARRVQLLSGNASTTTALSAMAINNKGVLAFAMYGVVCVTSLSRLAALPRV